MALLLCAPPIAVAQTTSDPTPGTRISSLPEETTSSRSASFAFYATEPDSTFECRIDASVWEACDSPTVYSALAPGEHSFHVRAIDSAGQRDPTPSTYTWTIDPRPETLIDAAPNANEILGLASFSFYSTEPDSTFECRIDASAWEACDSPKAYSMLADGDHVFYVRAVDSAGQRDLTPAAHSWRIGAMDWPPGTRISSAPDENSTSRTASFAFYSTEPNSTFECRLDAGAWETCQSPKAYSSLADGDHVFRVRAIDSIGQRDPTPSTYTWTVGAITDPRPDTRIGSAPDEVLAVRSAAFVFSSNEPNSTFECRLDAGVWEPCQSPKAYSALDDGEHAFYVRALDSAGQRDLTPATHTWTVDATPDPRPDTRIGSGPSRTSTSRTASFGFYSTEPNSTFECRLDANAWTTCASPKAYSGLADGQHSFYVSAIDSAGQRDLTPSSYVWTINTTPDSTLFFESFDLANGANNLITNEYAGWHASDGTAVQSNRWRSDGGSLFSVPATDAAGQPGRVGYTGKLDSGSADKYSQSYTHSNKMRFWTKLTGFDDVRVDADLKPLAWHASAPSSWAGFKFYLRRTFGVTDSPFYTVEPFIKDGHVYIQKKCLGNTGGGNYSSGGTYYTLANKTGFSVPLGAWQRISATVRTGLDGSVTIGLYRGGTLLAQAVDHGIRSDGTGCPPLIGGRVGFRSDFFEYYLDNFRVSALF